MNTKRHGSLFQPHNRDSYRLTETFFTQTPVKKPSPKKPVAVISLCCIVLLAGLFYVVKSYQFIFIPRAHIAGAAPGLLNSGELASLSFINNAGTSLKAIGPAISLTVPRKEKVGVIFNLARPHNLHANALIFAIQNTAAPLLMDIIVKDTYFHSTALNPVSMQLATSKEASLTKIPVSFEPAKSPNVNFSQINQIKVFFRYDNTSPKPSNIALRVWEKHYIIIKDVLLVEKEGKV